MTANFSDIKFSVIKNGHKTWIFESALNNMLAKFLRISSLIFQCFHFLIYKITRLG